MPEQAHDADSVRARIHPDLPEFVFTLVGPKPAAAGEARIERIEIREAGAEKPLQIIAGLDVEAPSAAGQAPLEVLDMNFDGYGDIRVVEFRAAGPNTPYRNWLYQPATKQFVASPELDAIPSARFDAASGEIHSEWRDGANRYGVDVYRYIEGKPVLVAKEERTYREPGVYTLKRSRRVDGAWTTVEEREVRDDKASAAGAR